MSVPSLPILDRPPLGLASLKRDASSRRVAVKGRYAFVSLGCPKNAVDSERMLGLLRADGYDLVADPQGADFVVVNTCGFIDAAREESFGVIDEMLALKRSGAVGGVVVAGCLAERQKEAMLGERPEIDHLVGVFSREEIARVADRLVGRMTEQRTVFRPAGAAPLPDRGRLRVTPRHFAYLKISEGCDRLCTFCAIPKMRGKHVSKPPDEVVAEAEELAADGVRELILVAQDTPYYGRDLYGEPRLAELLGRLDAVDGIEWIRLMYFYPMYVDDAVIDAIAGSRRVVPYIDMPLQHASDAMLRRMARRVNRAETESLLARLRERIDGLTLRTTFITGFPGETDEDFAELMEFVRGHEFERMGVFTYSIEPDTPAAKLPDHVPGEVAQRRRDALMQIQQEITLARNASLIGTPMTVLLDAPVETQVEPDGLMNESPQAFVGRTTTDAPDVDCVVYVTGHGLRPGQFTEVEIVGYDGYDLIGVVSDAGSQRVARP